MFLVRIIGAVGLAMIIEHLFHLNSNDIWAFLISSICYMFFSSLTKLLGAKDNGI